MSRRRQLLTAWLDHATKATPAHQRAGFAEAVKPAIEAWLRTVGSDPRIGSTDDADVIRSWGSFLAGYTEGIARSRSEAQGVFLAALANVIFSP